MFDISTHKAELKMICDFSEIYEKFRLVDPATKNIYTLANGEAVPMGDVPCYKIWNRNEPCDNCISMRTCREQMQYIKLENLGSSILLVVSRPVTVKKKQFSLELITDVTNSMVVQEEGTHVQTGITGLIAEVNRLSIRDTLTGLYNNNFMKNRISELVSRSRPNPFSLLVIDIDRFKLVNDSYGHMAGDVVIQTIATKLNDFFVQSDCYVGRMGGDEYCVILDNCTLSEAESLSVQISKKIKVHQYDGRDGTFTVDVSIGVGQYIPGENTYAFVDRIDSELYKRKHIKKMLPSNVKSL